MTANWNDPDLNRFALKIRSGYGADVAFTAIDFKDLLATDLWVLGRMLTLPSDPEPVVQQDGGNIVIEISDTVAMSQMQEAVTQYRRPLIPVIFVVTQKIYAELFRLLLNNTGVSAGTRQVDVEVQVCSLLSAGKITVFTPFADTLGFEYCWSRHYDFNHLRLARNQIVHAHYQLAAGHLTVADAAGIILLDWREPEVLDFAMRILQIAGRV
ncbi:MAG TPA: hypothetical protein VFC63_03640 [Blastocatellia bacterium]|nr:hypothetical protein [Blastocatellia bacterium]